MSVLVVGPSFFSFSSLFPFLVYLVLACVFVISSRMGAWRSWVKARNLHGNIGIYPVLFTAMSVDIAVFAYTYIYAFATGEFRHFLFNASKSVEVTAAIATRLHHDTTQLRQYRRLEIGLPDPLNIYLLLEIDHGKQAH